jgi:hypothetical protein
MPATSNIDTRPGWSQRALRTITGAVLAGAMLVSGLTTAAVPARAATPIESDAVAQTYYQVLLKHTQFAESKWEAANQRYTSDSYFGESLVLGNAVLLTRGSYDESAAGISKADLLDHTVKSIKYFAATNKFNGGTLWGKNLFWEATYESYFLAAAQLLWDKLDDDTRANVLNISKGQADYTVSLGSANDPGSGSWTPNGLTGGYKGDSKIEEMGVYALGIAPALAYNRDDANAGSWSDWLGKWVRNMTGLPVADKNNPATLGGVAVADNTAQNLYPGYLVENHDAFAPHYQQELWRTMARSSIHFLLTGQPVPDVLRHQVSGDEILSTILQDTSDAGEPFMVMNQDREFLYGRDVIPLAYLAQVQGNSYVARAEADLAARLLDFQQYGVAPRIAYKTIGAQTAGEIKYEGEARAEVAIAYLLHEYRAASDAGPVKIASETELFSYASGATDYGASRPGLLMHQSQNAWAATVDRAGYVKFAWQPEHDDWLFDVGGATPFFLPSTNPSITSRFGRAYHDSVDGFTGSASLLNTAAGRAGMTTLPTGTVVYSTSGTAYGEGQVSVRNLDMGTVRGLDGNRTYTTAEGDTVFTNQAAPTDPACVKPSAASRRDCLTFKAVTTRYLRIQGINRTNSKNYSLREVEARNGATGANVIKPTMTATERTSGATVNLPAKAIDGEVSTYWTAASTGGGAISDTDWWQVDLGEDTALDRVVLDWGTEPAAAYAVQVSSDGLSWQPMTYYGIPSSVSVFPRTDVRYVRYQGVAPNASYGYSIREIEVHDGADGADLAQQPGVAATASSWGSTLTPQREVPAALDRNFGTWWSVEKSERSRADSWYQLDLGSLQSVDRVVVYQETKPVAYAIQVSADGSTWNTVDFQVPGAARTDDAVFEHPVEARYLRMQGETGGPQYGYSMYEFQAFNGTSGTNVAAGKTASASSADTSKTAALAADGKYDTRWAVATADRGVGTTWLQVDLGSTQTIDRARLIWETPGLSYYVQTSLDGEHWTNQYEYNSGSAITTRGGWLTVDDRASFVVTGSDNPIRVVSGGATSVDRITLSAGGAAGAAGMVVEGYARTSAAKAAALADRPRASAEDANVTVSDADGYVSLFNLGNSDATTEVSLPQSDEVRLYQGTQTIGSAATTLAASVPAANSKVLAPLFTATGDTKGLVADVVNGRRVKLTATKAGSVTLVPRTGDPVQVDLVAGTRTVEFPATTRPYPLADLGAGATSYPSSPLPSGMSDPDLALDDDVATAWVPGSASGRMVVDLGTETDLGLVRVLWNGTSVPGAVLSGSTDGITFSKIAPVARGVVSETSLTGTRARYLALQVDGWQSSSASVATLSVYGAGADPVQVADELQAPLDFADKAVLRATVQAAAGLVEADYTTSSWAEADLVSLLASAQAVLDDDWALQTAADAASTALQEAVAALVHRGDPKVLETLVLAAGSLDGKLGGFTDASVAALVSALSDAKAVQRESADKSQAELDAAASALQAALSGLIANPVAVDKAVLLKVHDAAKDMSNADGGYTAASWSKLQDGIAAARTVLGDDSATQEQVDQAVTTLAAALSGLVPKVDTAVLRSVLGSATAVSNPNARYTAASWATLQDEIGRAKGVLADTSASQAKVDAAVTQLTAALAGLTPSPAVGQPKPVVTRIKLNQSQLRVVKGKTFRLEEGVYYTNLGASYAGQVRWSSSNHKVATVSGSGTITARKAGSVIITATTVQTNSGGRKLSAGIRVLVVKSKSKAKVTTVSAPVPRTMVRGQAGYVTGTYLSAKATGVKVTYSSSNASVAAVDQAGRILARNAGTVRITVRAGGKSGTYTLTVT